ncbi:hypothetical protein PHMEG_00014104 [Phytophthora megakarya]|uniref:Hook C-terminal domain-containing protein n=1 Tax=Phytophthora megakarya TaxID=4795 RepID=A0A225W4M4_9STRA|nr:hypothetical protein PHMEG_00014104 [Phytophthora megakarya]
MTEFLCLLRLLALAFPAENEDLKTIDGWSGVLTTLEGFYEAELTVDELELERPITELSDTLKAVLELVLGAVVQCETKEKFVKDILTMEDAVQTDLMRIIEKVMAKGAAILSERVQVDVVKNGENESPGLGSPLYLSRNAALERLKRENGVLKEENIHLARELEKMTTKYCEVETENMKLVEMMKQLKEQVESDVLRKERAMHSQYDERIQSLQLAKADLKDKGGLAAQVPQLRDELDLLRPLAEKMKKTDSTVAKYKAKIDELSGAKDRLRVTERANAELLEKNLVLENNLAKGASCQRKLNEVKAANTTAP